MFFFHCRLNKSVGEYYKDYISHELAFFKSSSIHYVSSVNGNSSQFRRYNYHLALMNKSIVESNILNLDNRRILIPSNIAAAFEYF